MIIYYVIATIALIIWIIIDVKRYAIDTQRLKNLRAELEELTEKNKYVYGKLCYTLGYKHALLGKNCDYEECVKQIDEEDVK